jgi:hypothetical protein
MQESEQNVINEKLNQILSRMEGVKIAEYVELVNNTKRMLFINFIAGIARGLGAAIGFIFLGAVMVWFLGKLAVWNIPIVGDYITEIVRIVMEKL